VKLFSVEKEKVPLPHDLEDCICFVQLIKPESNDKDTEAADESDLPEELCGHHLPQQSLKGYNDSPDVIIEAQFDDSDIEDKHNTTQDVLIDGVKNLSVCVPDKGESWAAAWHFVLAHDSFKGWDSLSVSE
jgi:hypothetical protein